MAHARPSAIRRIPKGWYGIIAILMAAFVMYILTLALARHDNFYSRRLDLGNMDQTVWNVIHGNGFTLTDPMGDRQESRLAVHADFLLILLSPLYLIWSDPKMLILVQVLVWALGALPVYWIAKNALASPSAPLFFAAMYLLYPPMQRSMLHDFHAVSLSATFLLFAYWFMQKRAYVRFAVFAILAALGKEQIWLTISFFGAYIALINKDRVFGILTAIVGASIFYILFWIAIPAVTPAKQHFALTYLSEYGGSLNEILTHIVANPISDLALALQPNRLYYYYQLLLPVGFLPLLSPTPLLFGLPSLMINTLSNNQLMRQIDYQYNSTIVPFIMIAAIGGYRRATRWMQKQPVFRRWFIGLFAVCVTASVYLWSDLPYGKNARVWYMTVELPEKILMQKIERLIPDGATVSATNNIGAHFSQREFLYNYPVNAQTADYTVIYLGDPYAWPSGDAQRNTVDILLTDPKYRLIMHGGKFYAFERL